MLKDESDIDPNDQNSILEHLDKVVTVAPFCLFLYFLNVNSISFSHITIFFLVYFFLISAALQLFSFLFVLPLL